VAIALILFYFRGELNFYGRKRAIVVLAAGWVAQNLFMVFTGAVKNGMYIHEYSLTYKRIDVYVWLLLVVFGLLTTTYKLFFLRTNMFLVRINSWLCFVSLVAASFFNWDDLITEYNIARGGNVDYAYLLSLSDNSLLPVYRACQDPKIAGKVCLTEPENAGESERTVKNISVKELVHQHLADFMFEQSKLGWQSTCLSKQRLLHQVKNINSL